MFGRQLNTTRADFVPLVLLIAYPVLLLVNRRQAYKTLVEFIEVAKNNSETIVYSSRGLYGATHLPVALFQKATGICKMRHRRRTATGRRRCAAIMRNRARRRSKIIDQTAASKQHRSAITNLWQELAYLNASEFAKVWEADAKRADEAVHLIGAAWRGEMETQRSLCTRDA